MLKTTALLATVLIVTGCSKASKSSGGSSMIEAQFIDEPVKGLTYTAASNSSKTGSQGKFNCIKGEKVGFKIAGLELGEAVCGEKIFVDDLVSDVTDHSPEKVAAIIQSFSVGGGSGELDLSTAVDAMPADALAALSFAGNDAAFKGNLETKVDAIKVEVPALASVIVAKDPADMRSILDAAIAAYSDLSDAFKALLAEEAHSPSDTFDQIVAADKIMTLTGKLTSNDPNDECYDYVQARVSVSQESSGKPYKFVVHKTASFDALDAYDNLTNICKDPYWCDQGTEFPAPKLITSSSISFFSKMAAEDFGYSLSSETVAVLNASIEDEEFKITGTFQEDGTYTEDGDAGTFSCKYSITSDETTIPATGPKTEEGDSGNISTTMPAEMTGTFSLNSGSISCAATTQALMTGGAMLADFDIAISGQSVTVSNTSTVAGTWTNPGFYKIAADDPKTYVFFSGTGNWHLDVDVDPSYPAAIGVYLYHKSGAVEDHYCSFSLDRNP